MTIEQALLTNAFQEEDARSHERNLLNEILDDDNSSLRFFIV